MQVRMFEGRRENIYRNNGKNKPGSDRRNLFCDNCEKPGHVRETSFKLHGFPDCYKVLVEQKRKESGGTKEIRGFAAQVAEKKIVDTTKDEGDQISEIVKREMMKYMKGKEKSSIDPL